MKRYCCMLLAVLVLLDAMAQDINVVATFDTSHIYIGDQLNYSIVVEQPYDVTLSIQQLKDTICDKVEILAGPVADTTKLENNRLKVVNSYLVTSFDTGFYYARPVYAQLSDNGGQQRFYSGYSPLEVVRVNIAPSDTAALIYDIVAPYKAPVTFSELVPWILLAVLSGLLIFGAYKLIYFIVKRNMKKDGVETVVPKEAAHVIAFRELDELQAAELWQKGEIKDYYTRLTEIVRRYLDNRYGISSMELTTNETLAALRKVGFKKDDNYLNLELLLDSSDLVKFAKHKPVNDEHETQFDRTHKFVEDTMEKVDVTTTEDTGKVKSSNKKEEKS